MTKVLIIGSGLGGYVLAKELRQKDASCQLTMVTQDNGEYYTKPSLSHVYAAAKTPKDLVMKRAEEMAKSLDMRILIGATVTGIDAGKKNVTVDNKEKISFDYLVLAVGAQPVFPSSIRYDARPFVVNSLDQFTDLYQHIEQKNESIAVLGAGLVGTEFAYDLSHHVQDVDWIYSEDWPLSRFVPQEIGQWLLTKMQALGVQPRFEQVRRVQQSQAHNFQVETNRQLRSYQTVLQAFGLVVDGSIYADAGIVCDRGFCTDGFLKTSVENIYAIGDCAQVNGIQLQYVAPIRAQAKALASTLSGEPQSVCYQAMATLVKTPKAPVCFSIPPQVTAQLEWKVQSESSAGVSCHAYHQGELVGFALAGDEAKQRAQILTVIPAWLK